MPTQWNKSNKVIVSRQEIANFNRSRPQSLFRDTRTYWFEFDSEGELIDTDCPEQDYVSESEIAGDCAAWLFDGIIANWMEEFFKQDLQTNSAVVY